MKFKTKLNKNHLKKKNQQCNTHVFFAVLVRPVGQGNTQDDNIIQQEIEDTWKYCGTVFKNAVFGLGRPVIES